MNDTPIYVPAGAWARARLLPLGTARSFRVEAKWDGAWHLATGELKYRPRWWHANAKMACGRLLAAAVQHRWDGVAYGDVVIADEMPLVDVCTKCARLAGATVTVRERLVEVTPAPR